MQVTIQNAGKVRRKTRSPRHNFNLITRPWWIQPFMLAPVWPGETLANVTVQSRVVTDPIKNPLIGWWNEYYLFYVKLRDLPTRDLMTQMLLVPGTDLSSLDGASEVKFYHENGTMSPAIKWGSALTEWVVEKYFRNEGELASDYRDADTYLAQHNVKTPFDSAALASVIEAAANVDENLVSTSAGQGDASANVYTSEIDAALKRWNYARDMKLTQMTFEDWCEQFGVNLPKEEELFVPELIRYVKDWQYPSNTIDPTNGTPRSAVSWSTSFRADKDRFFKEPGFIIGLTVCRPKVYFGNQSSSFAMLMNSPHAWLPPSSWGDNFASFIKLPSGDPPITNASAAYYTDIKDYVMYGDQFVNYAMKTAGYNHVDLPTSGLVNKTYPATTDMDLLFVADGAGVGKIKQDGVCELDILGRFEDTSPMNIGNNRTV